MNCEEKKWLSEPSLKFPRGPNHATRNSFLDPMHIRTGYYSKPSRSLQGSRTRSKRVRQNFCQAFDGNFEDDKDREEWICCRNCEDWFHLKCMNLTQYEPGSVCFTCDQESEWVKTETRCDEINFRFPYSTCAWDLLCTWQKLLLIVFFLPFLVFRSIRIRTSPINQILHIYVCSLILFCTTVE